MSNFMPKYPINRHLYLFALNVTDKKFFTGKITQPISRPGIAFIESGCWLIDAPSWMEKTAKIQK